MNNSSNCKTRGGGCDLSLFKCTTRDTGSFVSRNNDCKCRTSHLSLGITILSVESERSGSLSLMTLSVEPGTRRSLSLGIMIPVYNQGDRGHLSLGIVILTVEPGGLGSFVSRNTDYI